MASPQMRGDSSCLVLGAGAQGAWGGAGIGQAPGCTKCLGLAFLPCTSSKRPQTKSGCLFSVAVSATGIGSNNASLCENTDFCQDILKSVLGGDCSGKYVLCVAVLWGAGVGESESRSFLQFPSLRWLVF